MKTNYKKMSAFVLSLTSFMALSQSPPQGNPPSNNTNARAAAAWYRGGNFPNNSFANLFGTRWNSPIYTITNNSVRSVLNGDLSIPYGGGNINTSGFFGIGLNNYFASNSPLTMLHLEGPNNTPFAFGQYRNWMRTGTFMRENSDGMYVGLKTEGFNRSDAVVAKNPSTLSGEFLTFLQ